MKKYIFILIAVMICGTGYAQKGRHAVGVNTSLNGFLSYPESLSVYYEDLGLFIGLKYQYGISNTFRLDTQFSYEVTHGACWDGLVNLHTFFIQEGRFRPYLITGFSINNYIDHVKTYDDYYCKIGAGARLGLGLNTRLSYNWDLQLEVGYHTTFTEFVSLGLTYNL